MRQESYTLRKALWDRISQCSTPLPRGICLHENLSQPVGGCVDTHGLHMDSPGSKYTARQFHDGANSVGSLRRHRRRRGCRAVAQCEPAAKKRVKHPCDRATIAANRLAFSNAIAPKQGGHRTTHRASLKCWRLENVSASTATDIMNPVRANTIANLS
jgi:hypothetical protein